MAVQELPGVESAEVSLNEGWVDVHLAPASRVTIAAIRRTIREQGFDPREAEVRVSGRVLRGGGGRLSLVTPQGGAGWELGATGRVRDRLVALVGSSAVLVGRVADDVDGVTPRELEVQTVIGG